MKNFIMIMKAQSETLQVQLNTQREITDAQLKAQHQVAMMQQQSGKEERDLLQEQLKAVMEVLVDFKKKDQTSHTTKRFKVSPPSQLTPEMSVAKLKA